MNTKNNNNKGFAIILDSLIALILVLVIFTIYYGLSHSKISKTSGTEFKKLHYISEDVLDVLNKEGMLDRIGEEWADANGSPESEHWQIARNLTKEYLEKLIPEHIGYKVTIDEVPLYSSDDDLTPKRIFENESETKTHSTRLLVGYGAGLPTRGHVARAFLSKIREKKTSTYAYFGGFVGQGNLTRIIKLPSTLDKVQQVYIELASGGPFHLYVNDYDYGEFIPSDEIMSANIQEYLPSPWEHFNPGDNTVEIKFSSEDISEHFIGGGFIRVTYNTSEMETVTEDGETYYYFPGIEGLINLYSSIYVPGNLNSMEIYLKFFNTYNTFLTIGDDRVFESSGSNETQEVYLYDSNLTMLNYPDISLETVPLRLGTENVSYITNGTGNADVILITDLSGSMNWRLDSSSTGVTRSCTNPNLYSGNTKRISLAKCLDKEFVDIILNTTGNRVGLVGYSGIPNSIPTASSTMIKSFHDLSTNSVSLKTQINSYTASGATGICGAIRKARLMLEEQSNDSRQKFIIVMTDGLANVQCHPTNEDSLIGCIPYICPTTWFCPGGGCLYQECGDYVSDRASDDAIQDSCKAYNDVNATIYSIGFGPVASCPLSNQTLQFIASCGNGTYYASSDADELKDIYRKIAEQIVNMSYKAQTASIVGEMNKSILYPESYIKFSYAPRNLSAYGEITLTQNTERFNDTENCNGSIFITEYATVIDAKVTSYSAEHWTDFLRINSQIVYSLRDGHFGDNYLILGDPYIVQIPNPEETLIPGQVNEGEIRTGNSPTEDMGCSEDNSAIFTLRLKAGVGYGDVFPEKLGCNWKIQFEDNSYLEAKIPEDYAGDENCSYTAENISYNPKDAVDDAIYRLINKLDSNGNGKIDIKFDSDMIEFDFSRSGGVRSLWGPITLKLVLWM
jgi:hypothetical protein